MDVARAIVVYPVRSVTVTVAWYRGCGRCFGGAIVVSRVMFPIDRVDRVSCRQDSRVLTGWFLDWRARRNGRSQPRCSAPSGDRLVLLVQVLSRGV